jgi:uncharacterized integral membrane protein
MQVFFWTAFLIIIAVALFAVQNSGAQPVVIKFLYIWEFETSLVYTILGSVILGILIALLFWIPRAIRGTLQKKKLNQKGSST